VIAVQGPEQETLGRGIAECGSQELSRMLAAHDGPRRGILVRRENFLLLSEKESHAHTS
jgi:hypothetical protein